MSRRYLRTDKDFVIDSIAVLKDIVNRHTVAGFKDIPDGIIYRRFYQLIKFLQDNRLATRAVCNNQSDVDFKSELKNSDINDKGFYFLQYALPKWEDRLYKDQGEEKEWKYLEKWYQTFLDRNPDFSNGV